MKKKLALAIVATAIAAAPFAAAPAQATHLCAIWAPPFDRVPCTVLAIICDEPWPPLSICR